MVHDRNLLFPLREYATCKGCFSASNPIDKSFRSLSVPRTMPSDGRGCQVGNFHPTEGLRVSIPLVLLVFLHLRKRLSFTGVNCFTNITFLLPLFSYPECVL